MDFKNKYLEEMKRTVILEYSENIDKKTITTNKEDRLKFIASAANILNYKDALFPVCCELFKEILEDEFGEPPSDKTVH